MFLSLPSNSANAIPFGGEASGQFEVQTAKLASPQFNVARLKPVTGSTSGTIFNSGSGTANHGNEIRSFPVLFTTR